MRVIDVVQGSQDWKRLRAGRVTASRMCDVLAKITKGEAADRKNYKAQIVSEILTGEPCEDGFVSADMQRGTELEPLARAAYEVKYDVMADQVGFILHPTIDRAGASPDGLIGTDGGLEIKAPRTATHIQYLLDGVLPAKYRPQVQLNMACSGRQWWDFVSYAPPPFPEHLQLFVVRVPRDDKYIQILETEVIQFLSEVDQVLARLPQPEVVSV